MSISSPGVTQFTSRLEKRVGEFAQKHGLFAEGQTVVAGVSGGPDSTALLVILARLRKEFGVKLTAAHFDHMLRSRAEAEADRSFVERLCKSLRIPLETGRGDVARRAKREGESVEEAAREVRYAFLGAEAKQLEAASVVVGHTLDDRAETVLLHIVRGSGLDGLAAMPPRAAWPFGEGPQIVRPLLEVSRSEVEKYCDELGIEPRRDPTNDLPIATRNRVRNEVMPALRSINPKVASALARLADAAARDIEFMDGEAKWVWRRVASASDGQVRMRKDLLGVLPPTMAIRVLRRAAAEVGSEPEAEHLERIMESIAKPKSRISLPGGVAIVEGGQLIIARDEVPEESPAEPIPEAALAVPGRARAGEWTVEAQIVDAKAPPKSRNGMEALLAANSI